MSEWTDQINNHQVHDSLRAIRTAVETILSLEDSEREAAATERMERLNQVTNDLSSRLESLDPDLVPLQVLNNLQAPLQKIEAELSAYQSDSEAAHVNAAHNQLENVLVHTSNIPVPRSVADVEGIRDAVTSLRRSIGQNIRHLEDQSSQARGVLEDLQKQMKSLGAKVAQAQERADQTLTDLQQRFASTEEQRVSEFQAAESERKRQSKDLYDSKAEEWDAIIQEREEEYKTLYEKFETGFQAQTNALIESAQSTIQELETRKEEAEKLVGVITDTGMVGGYQKEANASKHAATFWRLLAAASLVGLIVFAVSVYIKSQGGTMEVSWPIVGWRVFVATAFGLLAAYAALQADKHDRTKCVNRKMELELAAISPYLQDLPPDKQIELKVELAQKLFGQAELPSGKMDKKTTGSVLDILKMAMEAIESLASK